MELSNKLTKYQPIPNLSIANFDPIVAADDYKAQSIEPMRVFYQKMCFLK